MPDDEHGGEDHGGKGHGVPTFERLLNKLFGALDAPVTAFRGVNRFFYVFNTSYIPKLG